MTPAEAKGFLGINSTQYDAQFEALLPLLEEEVMDRTGNPGMTAGMRLYVAKKARWLCDAEAGVTGEFLGDYSVSRVAGEPPEISDLLRGSYRVRLA